VTYTGGPITVKVEAAFGADPDVPSGWSWTDISSDLITPNGGLGPAVTIRKGRMNESGRATPTDVQFVLKNFGGQYTPGLATGSHYPNIRRNLPVRISLSGVGASDPYERVTAFVYSFEPGWDDSLRVSVIAVGAAGRFRRLQQGNKVIDSAMFSNIMHQVPPPYSYWPLEDGAHSTQAASALGQRPALAAGLTFAADSTPSGSKPLPTLNANSAVTAQVPTYTAAGFAAAGLAVRIPTAVPASTDLLRMHATGTAAVWVARIDTGSPDTLTIAAFDASGASLVTSSVNIDETVAYSEWMFVSLGVTQNGTGIDYDVGLQFANGTGVGKTGNLATNTVGMVTSLRVPVLSTLGLSGASIGHLCFWNDPTLVSIFTNTFIGSFIDESIVGVAPLTRYLNLRDAAGLTNVASWDAVATETSILMGPTAAGSVLDGWREVEDVDGGIIHDGDVNGDIDFLPRAAHYNAAVVMTVPMTTKSLQNPFAPTYDDQLVVTDSTVTVRDGSSATYSSDIGEGTYNNPVTLNLFDDTHAYEIAGWIVGRGTLAGMRYPKITINLRHPGQGTLPDQWLACKIGSRIQVTVTMAQHPPDTIDLELIGYTERFSSRWWDAELVCTPFAPYVVGVLNSATLGHLSATTCVLAGAGWNGSAGSFTTTSTPLLSTAAGDFPLDLNLAGQRVTVSACSGAANPQTLTVSVASVNGISKTHPAGESVALWQPLRLAL
jgi:hypothetical protein